MGKYIRSSNFGLNGNISIIRFYMKIASLSENKNNEKRIAITPETTKKFISNGFEVSLAGQGLWKSFRN